MNTEIEQIKTWKNGLRTCKNINQKFFKETSNHNQNLLFSGDGTSVDMGIDSHFQFQISSSNFENKKQLIEFMLEEIERMKPLSRKRRK